jgi:hypothetical protein
MRERVDAVLAVVGSLVWRGFGLFLFILGGSAGVGAVVSGSWITGVVIAWGTLMIGVVGAVGYAIATTGRADSVTVETAVQDAVQKAKEQQDTK